MRSSLIYCNALDRTECQKPFQIIIAKIFDSKPTLKECHNELEGAICEYNELSYFKENKHKKKLVFGYVRLADTETMRYYINDIIYIILVFYGNSQQMKDEEVYRLDKIKRIQKKQEQMRQRGYYRLAMGYMRWKMIHYHFRLQLRMKESWLSSIADIVFEYLYENKTQVSTSPMSLEQKDESSRKRKKKRKIVRSTSSSVTRRIRRSQGKTYKANGRLYAPPALISYASY